MGRRADGDPIIRLEMYGIIVLAFSATLLLALLTFDPADVGAIGGTRAQPAENIIGPIGAHVADIFLSALGIGAFAFALLFGWLGLSYLIGRRFHITRTDVLGWVGLLVGAAVLMHVGFAPAHLLGHTPGGLTGEYVGEVARALLSTTGTLILALTVVVVSLIAVTRRSVFELATLAARSAWRGGAAVVRLLRHGDAPEPAVAEGEGAEAAREPRDDDAAEKARGPKVVLPERRVLTPTEDMVGSLDEPAAAKTGPKQRPERAAPAEAEVGTADLDAPDEEPDDPEDAVAAAPAQPAAPAPQPAPEPEDDIKIVESVAMRRSRDLIVGEQIAIPDEREERAFELPTLSFLEYEAPEGQTYDRELLRANAQILESKLADYKVQGKVVEIHPGPVVTMYEFKPAPGIKISSIANLSDDLAMALSALRIRIVAPIPGKDVVGIEVPNKTRETVWLKEILSDGCYSRSKSKLTLALGKDIVGTPVAMDLAKAPHLLVAGATGAGKSVAINSFIVSLLYKATPQDVRLIMIDPKMLELSIYEGVPHLLLPVVTDPKQAATALRWAVKEMERRYRTMADLGVRNLANYNSKTEQLTNNPAQPLPERLALAKAKRQARGELDPEGSVLDARGEPLVTMPQIVVIIDELADLMMVAGKDVELCIARLAQMARAAGIHLVLATQRPSVDVITGLIKANFPTRMSFRVSSKIDSRTILDQGGAESLLGMGDMLWLSPGAGSPKRVHGCYVSEEEVHLIVRHLKQQGAPDYDLGILASDDEEAESGGRPDDDEVDELYDQAVRIVAETRNASISFLQRKLKIGYNRSARMVEKMEHEGVVGPSDGTSRPRDVFIDPI
ncbi:MAG: DNA translocase FtsK 4TM domain-containing protein [Deltaproteobacteria bacterium]|nr:DNA translocase FtsK 4TM domain-containing protein [Deltaproteobacteria bacterium]MCB9787843.1 DNA translocase FtsK 4TM domain-containing protein [Deltaproteobacteria bacterium]